MVIPPSRYSTGLAGPPSSAPWNETWPPQAPYQHTAAQTARRVAPSVVVVLGKGCVDVDGNGVVVFGAKGVIEDERPHRARSSKFCNT